MFATTPPHFAGRMGNQIWKTSLAHCSSPGQMKRNQFIRRGSCSTQTLIILTVIDEDRYDDQISSNRVRMTSV